MKKKKNFFEWFSNWATAATGSSAAFITATAVIVIWAVTGPVFHYSETWQLIINTGTTIITFLMVFLIQKAQNKDSKAIHLKLNELLASHEGTSNRMVNIEDLTEAELDHEWSEEIPAIFYVLKKRPGSPPHCITIRAIAKSLTSIANRLLEVL